MAQTKEGARKARQVLIDKLGSEEAYKEMMRDRGRKGGKVSTPTGGFASFSIEKHKAASAKGGRISRRKK